MNLTELQAKRDALGKALHELDRIKPSCNTCDRLALGVCGHYGQRPPDAWMQGPFPPGQCGQWRWDGIPF